MVNLIGNKLFAHSEAKRILDIVFTIDKWQANTRLAGNHLEETKQKVLYYCEKRRLWFKEAIDEFLIQFDLPQTKALPLEGAPFNVSIVLELPLNTWKRTISKMEKELINNRDSLIEKARVVFARHFDREFLSRMHELTEEKN